MVVDVIDGKRQRVNKIPWNVSQKYVFGKLQIPNRNFTGLWLIFKNLYFVFTVSTLQSPFLSSLEHLNTQVSVVFKNFPIFEVVLTSYLKLIFPNDCLKYSPKCLQTNPNIWADVAESIPDIHALGKSLWWLLLPKGQLKKKALKIKKYAKISFTQRWYFWKGRLGTIYHICSMTGVGLLVRLYA